MIATSPGETKSVVQVAPEGCLIGMAPTTSTTLALGDALAVALMSQRNFHAEDFRTFHPGGSLGAQMATVGQLMHAGDALPLVDADAPMSEVLLEMTSKSFGIAGVIKDGRLLDVISDGDLRRNLAGLMDATAVDDTGRPAGVLHIHDCLRAGAS